MNHTRTLTFKLMLVVSALSITSATAFAQTQTSVSHARRDNKRTVFFRLAKDKLKQSIAQDGGLSEVQFRDIERYAAETTGPIDGFLISTKFLQEIAEEKIDDFTTTGGVFVAFGFREETKSRWAFPFPISTDEDEAGISDVQFTRTAAGASSLCPNNCPGAEGKPIEAQAFKESSLRAAIDTYRKEELRERKEGGPGYVTGVHFDPSAINYLVENFPYVRVSLFKNDKGERGAFFIPANKNFRAIPYSRIFIVDERGLCPDICLYDEQSMH